MLFPHERTNQQSIAFRYLLPSPLSMQLTAMGWETADSSYRWNGLHRLATDYVIFQFTLAGQGVIRYGNREYVVPKHCGFFCTVPSDHAYFYDTAHDHWEFMFISVRGEDAHRHWTALIDSLGPVVSFQDQLEPFLIISNLYTSIYETPQLDKYKVSSELYRFVMETQRIAEGGNIPAFHDSPAPIRDAIRLMQTQFALPLSLDEIADYADLSKYHFCRIFQKKTGLKPMQFLRKVRIEKASILLNQTDKTIETIALETGFESSNYFIRVFKQMVGVTPNQYRLGSDPQTSHLLHIDK